MNKIVIPISNAAPGPLYQQIVDGIRREVVEGRLEPGQPLPSFRQLAAQLMVSIITVKRAYEELEREGVIFRKQGLGTYVAEKSVEKIQSRNLNHIEELIKQAVQHAKSSGMTQDEIEKLIITIIDQQGEQ